MTEECEVEQQLCGILCDVTDDQFDALVRKLEPYASSNPSQYRFRVGLLAALGYVYIFAVLAVLLVGIGVLAFLIKTGHLSALTLKPAIILLILILTILRSLWVTIPPPDGNAIVRDDFPELFQEIDSLSEKLRAPQFHHILINGEMNAAAAQHPRLGIFGWQENYLILGVPLMMGLTRDEFRSVVAHEMGHVSGNHGRFGGWIYRVRLTYMQLLSRLMRNKGRGVWLFRSFFGWYAPYFSAYSFVLARSNEFEADRAMADVVGPEIAGNALVRIAIAARYVSHRYWPDVFKRVKTDAVPPQGSFAELAGSLKNAIPIPDRDRWLSASLMSKTDTDDTHPALIDRLRALGYISADTDLFPTGTDLAVTDAKPALAPPPSFELSAADSYFGTRLPDIVERIERDWRQQVIGPWQKEHTQILERRRTLAALNDRVASQQPLTQVEEWERVVATMQLEGNHEVLPLVRGFLDKYPDNNRAIFLMGKCLLIERDPAGLEWLDRAMRADPMATMPVCELAVSYLLDQGRKEDADRYIAMARSFQAQAKS